MTFFCLQPIEYGVVKTAKLAYFRGGLSAERDESAALRVTTLPDVRTFLLIMTFSAGCSRSSPRAGWPGCPVEMAAAQPLPSRDQYQRELTLHSRTYQDNGNQLDRDRQSDSRGPVGVGTPEHPDNSHPVSVVINPIEHAVGATSRAVESSASR